MLLKLLPRPKRLPRLARSLHDGVWGYQAPRIFTTPDFSSSELDNRVENAPLLRLVESYRRHGHRAAKLDPLDLADRPNVPALDPRRYGFDIDPSLLREDFISETLPPLSTGGASSEALNTRGILDFPDGEAPDKSIEDISKWLAQVYCGGVGYEFAHLPSKHERRFLERLLESSYARVITKSEQLAYWRVLATSETFDHWAAKRFPNVKRYGLEGGEGMMVALAVALEEGSKKGIEQVVLSMPHRGRLNVLSELLSFDMRLMVRKMRGLPTLPSSLPPSYFTDDVLSHLFVSQEVSTATSSLLVHLLPNPSHLEAVNAVGLGFARGLQVPFGALKDDELGSKVLNVQIHGDSAFGGQGVTAETLNLANLPHFTAGGTIRIVVNNQLGYTTPASSSRSSFYATDLAKAIAAPIVHVNGDRIDDVARAMSLAVEYQQTLRKDVVIDLVVYRRRGHNELDEPAYTSPVMYRAIADRPSVAKIYEDSVVSAGVLNADTARSTRTERIATLDSSLVAAEPANFALPEPDRPRGWSSMKWPREGQWEEQVDTGVNQETLRSIGQRSVAIPDDITIHPKLTKMHIAKRLASLDSGTGLDFATTEALAFGSLVSEGYHVRLCGQDSGRGTFSQRHAIFSDQTSTRTTVPLQTLSSDPLTSSTVKPGTIEVVNSPLSEYAVVGFEQGIAWVSPLILPIWEAQFGDFHNTAQVAIDTYLGSSETKWGLQSALTLLLPHGYGESNSAGPEHSSARIERFLQLTNEPYHRKPFVPNLHLVNVTTAAQYFHALRRQMIRPYRKPLVIFSPKGILRLPAASSALAELAEGTAFEPVLADTVSDPTLVERIVFLTGKTYYDLVKERADRGLDDRVAFVRIEEISPFPYRHLETILAQYPSIRSFVWAQEEPENAGAFTFVAPRLAQLLQGRPLEYVGRDAMATPAPGVGSYFAEQKKAIFERVFAMGS